LQPSLIWDGPTAGPCGFPALPPSTSISETPPRAPISCVPYLRSEVAARRTAALVMRPSQS